MNTDNKIKLMKIDSETWINPEKIRWIKERDACYYICTKSKGCVTNGFMHNTHSVCKSSNSVEFDAVRQFIEGTPELNTGGF